MKVFVTGGTGFVGGHLRRALLERGHTVRLLVHGRRPPLQEGEEVAEGDVTRLETFRDAASGCDALIHLVGIIREFPARGVTFEKLHAEATRNAVEAARQCGVRRYLQMSANGTRPGAVSGYHRTKWKGEELVRSSGLDWTIFRPSLIFGPRDSFVNMLADMIRRFPVIPVIGDGSYRLQPIHGDDVARCFAEALERPDTVGKTYTLCGDTPLTYRELLQEIGRALGKSRVPVIHQPLPLMRMIVPLMERFDSFPLTSDQLTMLLEENVCDGSWKREFGFDPVPFSGGIRSYLTP